jgi:hypothetical protein
MPKLQRLTFIFQHITECGRILCDDAFLTTRVNSRQVLEHIRNSCRNFWNSHYSNFAREVRLD